MLLSERPPIYACADICVVVHLYIDVQRITLNASSCITILVGRTEQLHIIAVFLPRHWLYEWFSQFHSCGTYSVPSRSHSVTYITYNYNTVIDPHLAGVVRRVTGLYRDADACTSLCVTKRRHKGSHLFATCHKTSPHLHKQHIRVLPPVIQIHNETSWSLTEIRTILSVILGNRINLYTYSVSARSLVTVCHECHPTRNQTRISILQRGFFSLEDLWETQHRLEWSSDKNRPTKEKLKAVVVVVIVVVVVK